MSLSPSITSEYKDPDVGFSYEIGQGVNANMAPHQFSLRKKVGAFPLIP